MTMNDKEMAAILTECLNLWNKVQYPKEHTSRFYANKILQKIENYPVLLIFITYNPHRRAYKNRFIFDREAIDKFYKEFMVEPFVDDIDYDAPRYGGLYFVGQCVFNPYTDEKFYWVKIGRGANLNSRLNQYNTCTPALWRIGYLEDYEAESKYHALLKSLCLNTHSHSREWFRVDRETYLEMCDKGFSYFD